MQVLSNAETENVSGGGLVTFAGLGTFELASVEESGGKLPFADTWKQADKEINALAWDSYAQSVLKF